MNNKRSDISFWKVTIVLLILLLSLSVYSKEFSYKDHSHFIGTKASNISGYGIYYSKLLSQDYRLQAMGLLYYYQYTKEEDRERNIINYDIGLELQRFIFNGKNMRTYILAGGYYYFDDDTETITDTETQVINHSYNIGVGLGFEFYYKKLIFNIDLGYKLFEDNLKTYINDVYQYPTLERTTKVGAGIGVGFMF